MKTSLCMLFAGLLLVGCSADEEIATISNSASNAISFNVVSNNPQTKAATIINKPDDLKYHKLEVFAFKNGTYYMGSEGTEGEWKDHGVELMYKSNSWIYTDPNAIYYWPHQEALDFYAVSPSEVIPSGSLNYVSIASESKCFSCLLADDKKDAQVDAMYAMHLGVKKDDTMNGTVQLQFKHALSQIVFNAKKNDKSQTVNVEIQGIRLCNVMNAGTFTFPTSNRDKGNWAPSTLSRSFYNIEFVSDAPIVVAPGTEVTNLSGGKPLLCIPQVLMPWNHLSSNSIEDKGGDITDKNETSFLRIECKIYDDDHYFVGSANGWGYTYVPFGATWEEGKRYVYTLCFGAGYDENGKEIDIVPITFDAEVTDWVESRNDINNF